MDERSFWPCVRHIDTKIRGPKNKMKLQMKERLKVTQTNNRLIFTLERENNRHHMHTHTHTQTLAFSSVFPSVYIKQRDKVL